MVKYFRFPYFIFFLFACYLLWASLLCRLYLHLSSRILFFFLPFGFFFLGKRSTSLRFFFYSLLARSLAAILTMLRSLLSHYPFSLWFPLFHSVVILTGYLLSAARLLDSVPWILVRPSTYVHVCLLNLDFSFIFSAPLSTSGWWSMCSSLFSPQVGCAFWVPPTPRTKWGRLAVFLLHSDSAALQLFIS